METRNKRQFICNFIELENHVMGHSYQFICKDCRNTQQLYQGWSFMIHDQAVNDYLQSSQVKLHYKTHLKILQLNEKYQNLYLKMEYRIYRCRKCLQVSDRLFVHVMYEDIVLHKTHFRCSSCKITVKPTNIHRLKFAICPKCKSKRFEKSKELMLWN